MSRICSVFVAACAVGTAFAQAAPVATPRPAPKPMAVPADFNDHAGFTQLFDGKTLTGWDGDPKVWSVVDGAMVGQFHAADGVRNAQSYIVLQGKEPADFELRLEIKMEGPTADSGIQYRSAHPPPTELKPGMDPKLITDPRYNAVGLQYDFNQQSGIGTIAESGAGARGIVVPRDRWCRRRRASCG